MIDKYSRENLNKIAENSNATVTSWKPKKEKGIFNVKATIFFTCGCGKNGNMVLETVVKNSILLCRTCARKNSEKHRKYDLPYLKELLRKDNASLPGKGPKKVILNTDIKYECACGEEHCKKFTYILKSGARCPKCTKIKQQERLKETVMRDYGVESVLTLKSNRAKSKEAFLLTYGVDNPIKSDIIQKRIQETSMKKYGTRRPQQSKIVQEKTKSTNLEKYGSEYIFQIEEFKEKSKSTNLKNRGVEYPAQSEEVQKKRIETVRERFGVDCVTQSEEVKEKMQATNMELYGVKYAGSSEIIKERKKVTNMKNFGVEHVFQSKVVQAKIEATNLEKYGETNPMKVPEIAAKVFKSGFKRKAFLFPSGREVFVQGYEPMALGELVLTHHEDDVIAGDVQAIPVILWYDENRVQHTYYPDIFISSENLLIEVKSTYFLSLHEASIYLKMFYARKAGYEIEMWVYSRNKKETKEIITEIPKKYIDIAENYNRPASKKTRIIELDGEQPAKKIKLDQD